MGTRNLLMSAVLIFLLVLTGCPPPPPPPPPPSLNCELGDFKQVMPAIESAKSNLVRDECRERFQEYYSQLVEVAGANPDAGNYDLFDGFITWGYEQQLLSSVEASTLFTTYFSTNFTTLPDSVSTCSSARKIEDLRQRLDQELRKKEKGLAQALGDQASYQQAYREMNQVLLVIESVGIACEQQS